MKSNAIDTPLFLRDLPSQFEPLRPLLEASLQPYIKIRVGEKVGRFQLYFGLINKKLDRYSNLGTMN